MYKYLVLLLVLLSLNGFTQENPTDHEIWPFGQEVNYNFDIDNNIFNLPTKISIYKIAYEFDSNGKPIAARVIEARDVPTDEFALIRSLIGNPESKEFASFELVRPDHISYIAEEVHSFKYFRDSHKTNHFRDDVMEGHENNHLKGPMFEKFQLATSYLPSTKSTFAITARGQSPKTISEGFALLVDLSYSKYSLSEGQVIPINYLEAAMKLPSGTNDPATNNENTSLLKVEALLVDIEDNSIRRIDELNKKPISRFAASLLSPEGRKNEKLHLFPFSDDDHKTFKTIKDRLAQEMKEKQWKNVKILLSFTGKNKPGYPSRHLVLQRDGTYRMARKSELNEDRKIINHAIKHGKNRAYKCPSVLGTDSPNW